MAQTNDYANRTRGLAANIFRLETRYQNITSNVLNKDLSDMRANYCHRSSK